MNAHKSEQDTVIFRVNIKETTKIYCDLDDQEDQHQYVYRKSPGENEQNERYAQRRN